jgi:hypothetical protein
MNAVISFLLLRRYGFEDVSKIVPIAPDWPEFEA